jgi:hypothetical protein
MNNMREGGYSMSTQLLPDPLKVVFNALNNEISYLHGTWDVFHELFGSEESVDVLNKVAPGAFRLIRETLRNELLLAVCRITDPKQSMGKQNLTVKQLLDVVEKQGVPQDLLKRLNDLEVAIDDHCLPIRDHRNKVLGHLDLNTALDYQTYPLPNVTSVQITGVLRMLHDFMNAIAGHFVKTHIEHSPVITGRARNIVIVLKDYLRLRGAEHDRLLAEIQPKENSDKS